MINCVHLSPKASILCNGETLNIFSLRPTVRQKWSMIVNVLVLLDKKEQLKV
jgi:hypothetical protein